MLNKNKNQCILYLIRHGQTEWNAQKRLQGHIDIPLNEVGVSEAELVAQEFEDHSLDAIYSSPLQRAHETARIINRAHQHEIQTHPALKEAAYGPLDGVTLEEFHRRCNEVCASFTEMSLTERLHFKIDPLAESYFEVYQRVKPLLDQMILKHLGQKVVVVTHGGLMRSLVAVLAGNSVREVKVQNVGCLTLQGDGAQLSIIEYKRIHIEKHV